MSDKIQTPKPILLGSLQDDKYRFRWVPVTEALPPQRRNVLVAVRGDNCPAYGWLKFAAGDRTCPYFVVPQRAAIGPRNAAASKPDYAKNRTDVTHWYVDLEYGLPDMPSTINDAEWGLGDKGFEPRILPPSPSDSTGDPVPLIKVEASVPRDEPDEISTVVSKITDAMRSLPLGRVLNEVLPKINYALDEARYLINSDGIRTGYLLKNAEPVNSLAHAVNLFDQYIAAQDLRGKSWYMLGRLFITQWVLLAHCAKMRVLSYREDVMLTHFLVVNVKDELVIALELNKIPNSVS